MSRREEACKECGCVPRIEVREGTLYGIVAIERFQELDRRQFEHDLAREMRQLEKDLLATK